MVEQRFKHVLMFEPANVEAIHAVARRSACARIYLTNKTGERSPQSLRTMLFEYSRRVAEGFVAVLYHEQALGIKLGLDLRRDSGVADPGYDFDVDSSEVPGAATFAELVAGGLTPRCATRSAFVGPRIIRRIVRAGLSIVEVDQCNAVLAAQHLRDVQGRALHVDAVLGEVMLHDLELLAAVQHRLAGNAAHVQAGAPQAGLAVPLEGVHAGRLEAQLGRTNGRHVTRGAPTNHQYVERIHSTLQRTTPPKRPG